MRFHPAAVAVFCLLLPAAPVGAQNLPSIRWQAPATLAPGVTLRSGSSTSPLWQIRVVELDMNDPRVDLAPVGNLVAGTFETTSAMGTRMEAIAAINAGYFGGGQSYSHLLIQGSQLATSVSTRPPRSVFGLGADNTPLWQGTVDSTGQPSPAAPEWSLIRDAIGGGPRLVTTGRLQVDDVPEGFDAASGIGPTVRNPRTALGWNPANRRIWLVVVDGRQPTWSVGMTLAELGNLLLDLGATEGMNYDGGGSTTLWANGSVRNRPSDGTERAVVSAWVVLPGGRVDNGDARCTVVGAWQVSANAGFYYRNSLVKQAGTGSATVTWHPPIAEDGLYEVRARWVSASNRATAAPFTIHHAAGTTTVTANQRERGSQWVALGSFPMRRADGRARIVLSDAAEAGSFVSADAIEIVRTGDLPPAKPPEAWILF
jgi:hypothetical protein